MSGLSIENLAEAKEMTKRGDSSYFKISEMIETDITTSALGWSGGPLHLEAIQEAFDRVRNGETEMLCMRIPNGLPIAKGGIDYTRYPGKGYLWMLNVHPDLQSLGLGTLLIEDMERRIHLRNSSAILAVEKTNHRAEQLYKNLGYVITGEVEDSWPDRNENGEKVIYRTTCSVMEK